MAEITHGVTDPTEYVQFWNDTLAVKFNRFRHILMDGLSYHSRVPLGNLALAPGARVVDVGCGWGDTALALAEKTGAQGYVLGIDCVDDFLERAREEARRRALHNVDFVAADVERYPFQPAFDMAFSRFGMMFFENPVAAMRNVRSALRPGGELMFIVWRDVEDNPWLGLPKEVVLDYLPPPGEDARTCGPGPFSMANPEVVTRQLEIAGFGDIGFERIDGPVTVGDSLDDAIAFQLAIGPAGEVFREAGEVAAQRRDEIEQALAEALRPYLDQGKVVMPSSSWCISARRD
ncbi:class I SAM-dependent methyltransferase [Alkalilimnicola ehrlichii MLHE-1]|uniref:Methyltransferase type 11 n=1 Tax=Alkalilimnicola ehrlichii (strain ATCC BAA-1101 / DSM 17681 / MLHE-1) TaxID=187272 RepID=Q0A880_ALKEH|nr:class I SAM-dependent methyltransferase [Alkalilimnicola ehrlichii]ABI56957.1 Methyltransferase type 11 [Alkalilimnicola ehrlichii MLHE-1]